MNTWFYECFTDVDPADTKSNRRSLLPRRGGYRSEFTPMDGVAFNRRQPRRNPTISSGTGYSLVLL